MPLKELRKATTQAEDLFQANLNKINQEKEALLKARKVELTQDDLKASEKKAKEEYQKIIQTIIQENPGLSDEEISLKAEETALKGKEGLFRQQQLSQKQVNKIFGISEYERKKAMDFVNLISGLKH
jgi:hypothetical protein